MANRADGSHVTNQVQYVRQQKGHSIIIHVLLIFVGIGMFTVPYSTFSKNHYWHAWPPDARNRPTLALRVGRFWVRGCEYLYI